MGHTTPEHGSASAAAAAALAAPKRATASLLVSITALMALWGKQAISASKKLETKLKSNRLDRVCPNRLLKSISHKAMALLQKKKKTGRSEKDEEGGIWQKSILMGDKCQPLDFSGVIYYDSNGKQLNEVPLRSPRASPLPGFITTTHHVY